MWKVTRTLYPYLNEVLLLYGRATALSAVVLQRCKFWKTGGHSDRKTHLTRSLARLVADAIPIGTAPLSFPRQTTVTRAPMDVGINLCFELIRDFSFGWPHSLRLPSCSRRHVRPPNDQPPQTPGLHTSPPMFFSLALWPWRWRYLGLRFFDGVDAPLNMQAPVFGSASAPYSDALLWIYGGMQFLLEGSDVALTPYLYRPTIGILFGSVMAVFNSAEAVPAFFFFSILCVLAVVGLIAIGTRIALMFGLWAMLCVALPGAPLWHALVNVPMPDLPALLFSLSGLFFVLLFLDRRAGVFALCVGLLFTRYGNGDPWRAVAGRISSHCVVLLAAWLEECRTACHCGLGEFSHTIHFGQLAAAALPHR